MDSNLDPLEKEAFKELAIRDAHIDARTLITKLLNRQSLTEIPVDYSRGLKDALKLAKDCKGLLHTELYVEALTVFVKAFAISPFCLESLEEVTEKLMYALNLVLHNHVRKYGHRPMPDVCKAAKLIMLGFQMVPVPPVQEVIDLLMEDSCGYRDWSQHQAVHRLDFDQLIWVIDVAKFKTCYRMALHCKVDRDRKVNAYWHKFASNTEEIFDDMCTTDPTHPFVLQAFVQCSMLLQSLRETLGEPFNLEWDTMQGMEGYQVAMHRLADPALAMNHLLQAMYASIQSRQTLNLLMGASWDILSVHEKISLRRSADTIVHLIDVLQIEPYVWDSVKGKILASMFILANTWDLAAHLGNHQLVRFINDQHSIQHELLQRPKASSEPIYEELVQGLDDISSLVKKLRPVSESDDDQQFRVDQRCTRCDRRITTKSEAVQCKLCGCPYCSPDCQRKHAQLHKGPCKRAKLKAKLAAKPSAK